ncbi:patatin-like phospholipase family protein [Bacillus horti]|uniref:NTE family protein n=1 Tax=Caldalkalibacillus horti TaxID=77523 RepID=A0ABT9VUB8_9BACI|nr:patatin-like phospholipase family protein [Bacillus horti]MDQ0164576.1 NTE family protein [Bacillus horti]
MTEGTSEAKPQKKSRPTIGLALGSGGARGLAHIGILEVFEEHGITIDYLAGSSAGALVGSLYSAGLTPKQIKNFASHFPRKYWVDYTVPKMGLLSGDKVKEVIRLLTKKKNIEETSIPLAIVATDLQKGARKVFTDGPIAEAVRASISIPGIFVPEMIDNTYYVDGGVIDRVPVSVVKEMGADLVIAVDVSFVEAFHPITSIFDVIARSIDVMEREILRYRMLNADVLIRPKVGSISPTMFTEVEQIVKEGMVAAEEAVPTIKALIADWKENTHESHQA